MPPVPIRIFFVSEPGARQKNLRARVGKTAQSVMLGEPIALVAKGFSSLREFERGGDGVACGVAGDDRRLVEDGKLHAFFRKPRAPRSRSCAGGNGSARRWREGAGYTFDDLPRE